MTVKTFNVKEIEALQATGVEKYYWDKKQPGLGLRLNVTGERFFVVQYRVKGGPRRRIALGRYGSITLDEARDRARRFVTAGLDGRDVHNDREALANTLTFAELAQKWIDLHVRPKRAAKTLSGYEGMLRRYLRKPFGKRAVRTITRAEALALHKKMSATPKAANDAIVAAKAAVNFGLKSNLLPTGMENPFAGIELYKREDRERYLSEAEVARIGDAMIELEASGAISPWSAAAIRLLVFTGCRKDEILSLRWEWVDFDAGVLLLPTSKTGKRRIELSAAAVEILKALPRIPGNAYAINGQRPGKHIVSLQVPWKKICVKAGVTACRVHDLRHSFASFAASDGLSLLMIGKLLGHKTPATTARYAHLTDSALKRANEGIGARLGGLLSATVKVRGVKSDG